MKWENVVRTTKLSLPFQQPYFSPDNPMDIIRPTILHRSSHSVPSSTYDSLFLLVLAARCLPAVNFMLETSLRFSYGRPLVWRRKLGILTTNVEHVVGNLGYEIGDSGAQTSELALNILTALYPPTEGDRIPVPGGYTSHIALKHHQNFKFSLLCEVGKNKGTIPWSRIAYWVKKNIENQTSEENKKIRKKKTYEKE